MCVCVWYVVSVHVLARVLLSQSVWLKRRASAAFAHLATLFASTRCASVVIGRISQEGSSSSSAGPWQRLVAHSAAAVAGPARRHGGIQDEGEHQIVEASEDL